MKLLAASALLLALGPAAEVRSVRVNAASVKWTPMKLPGVPVGLEQRLLHDNRQNKLTSALVRFPKGFREPRHYHTTCGHSMYILKGKLKSPDGDLTPGVFSYAAVNERHGPFFAEEETEFLFYTDGPFDFFVEDKP
jgi:quercetin dioxygenase-like cupin family protein